jgi:hypothetical protein
LARHALEMAVGSPMPVAVAPKNTLKLTGTTLATAPDKSREEESYFERSI